MGLVLYYTPYLLGYNFGIRGSSIVFSHPPIDTDLLRLKKKNTEDTEAPQKTQKFSLCVSGRGDASPLLCASALTLASFGFLASLALTPWRPWRYYPPIDTDLHRLKKNHRGHRKLQRTQKIFSWRPLCPWQPWRPFFVLSAPLFTLRLCVLIHRLTQIYTD